MFSVGSVMKLKPSGYAGYKKAHDEIWPDLVRIMVKAKVGMSIYKHNDLLFVHGVAPTEEDWDSVAGTVVDRWLGWMTDFLETDDSGRSIVIPLEEAFSFGIFRS